MNSWILVLIVIKDLIIKSILIAQITWIFISLTLCIILINFYEYSFSFAWYDIWEGIYYNRKKRIIYINPLPCIVFSFDRNNSKRKKKDNNDNDG